MSTCRICLLRVGAVGLCLYKIKRNYNIFLLVWGGEKNEMGGSVQGWLPVTFIET